MAVQTVTSLAGQSEVGQMVTFPWVSGSWEVTQGWGPVELSLEPAGHGYPHWHAGADLGLECGTVISMPHGLTGTARWIDNPGGYGTALKLELGKVDVWLGHLRQRLVADGQQLRGGEQLAVSNSTGSSTGCHLHFEVRPAGGRYGTDIDPSSWVFDPAGGGVADSPGGAQLLSAQQQQGDPLGIQAAVSKTLAQGLAMGQVGLGGTMMLGGLVVLTFGLRGRTAGDLQAAAQRTWRRGSRAVEGRRRENLAQGAEDARVDRQMTRYMTPEELERWRAGDRAFIPEAVRRRQRGARWSDTASPEQLRRAGIRRRLRGRPAPEPEVQIDVEGGLERMRAARVSRVRRSHQKIARTAVLRDSAGQVIPF